MVHYVISSSEVSQLSPDRLQFHSASRTSLLSTIRLLKLFTDAKCQMLNAQKLEEKYRSS